VSVNPFWPQPAVQMEPQRGDTGADVDRQMKHRSAHAEAPAMGSP
jgi:hypothetical protein